MKEEAEYIVRLVNQTDSKIVIEVIEQYLKQKFKKK